MSTILERVISESIERCEKRIAEIEELIYYPSISKLFALQKETIEECQRLNKIEGGTRQALAILEKANIEEKRLNKIIEQQRNIIPLIDEASKCRSELSELRSELYRVQRQSSRRTAP